MNVKIEIIPHTEQRYPTVGDWYFEHSCPGAPKESCDLVIRVSKLSDWRLEMLVAIHEMAEVVLCKDAEVSQESVDAFDIEYEKDRKEGDNSEPGDSPLAPYRKQHCIATGIERILAAEMGVVWNQYEAELETLP